MSDEEGNIQSNSRSLITTIKRQRNCNKLHVERILEKIQSITATLTEDDSNQFIKVKLTANCDILSSKVTLIKSFDKIVLDAITTDEDIEKEIFESSEFKRCVSEMITYIDMWINSHKEEVMSNQT